AREGERAPRRIRRREDVLASGVEVSRQSIVLEEHFGVGIAALLESPREESVALGGALGRHRRDGHFPYAVVKALDAAIARGPGEPNEVRVAQRRPLRR